MAMNVGSPPWLGDVLLHPGDRPLHVDDVVGPCRSWAQPVVDADAHPALLGEMGHHRTALLLLLTGHPRATVDVDEDGCVRVERKVFPAEDVESVAAAELAVGQVAPGRRDEPLRMTQRRPRDLAPGQPSEGIRVLLALPVVGTQLVLQRLLEDIGRLLPLAVDRYKAAPRGHGQGETHGAGAPLDVSASRRHSRERCLGGDGVQGKLRGEPAGKEAKRRRFSFPVDRGPCIQGVERAECTCSKKSSRHTGAQVRGGYGRTTK